MKVSLNLYSACLKLFFIGLTFISVACNKKPKKLCDISENITYTKDIAPLIEVKCFKCHDVENYKTKASRNKIYDYSSLKKMAESGFLIGSLTHQQGYIPMPYRANKKIDTCSIALIASWISTGMKE